MVQKICGELIFLHIFFSIKKLNRMWAQSPLAHGPKKTMFGQIFLAFFFPCSMIHGDPTC